MDKATVQTEVIESFEQPTFMTEAGSMPVWDDPTLRGYRKHPNNYKPMTTLQSTINLERRKLIDHKDIQLLKVLGDAIAPNENQLRRYMDMGGMSHSDVSARLKRFRTFGLAERWYVNSDISEWERRPPAPHTLGISGYKFLKHYYNECFFMDPERWDKFGIRGIQRYVSLNELRCQLSERNVLSGWVWQGIIAKNVHLKRAMGVAWVRSPKGDFHMIIEKAQQGMDYISHLRDRLDRWTRPYEHFGTLPVRDIHSDTAIVVLAVSTRSLMHEISNHIPIGHYSFPIWFYCEEDNMEHGLEYAFYLEQNNELKRIKLGFLAR